MDLMFQPLRKYAVFEGRARRAEYWLFTLLSFLVVFGIFGVALLADLSMPNYAETPLPFVIIMAFFGWTLGTFIPGLAVTVRRLHDMGQSGLWVLLAILPLGGLVILVMTLIDGTAGRNKYGPDPKGRGEPATATVFD